MSGRELKQIAESMRLPKAELARLAEVSEPTVTKVFEDLPVKATTRSKVVRALERFRAEQGPTGSTEAAG